MNAAGRRQINMSIDPFCMHHAVRSAAVERAGLLQGVRGEAEELPWRREGEGDAVGGALHREHGHQRLPGELLRRAERRRGGARGVGVGLRGVPAGRGGVVRAGAARAGRAQAGPQRAPAHGVPPAGAPRRHGRVHRRVQRRGAGLQRGPPRPGGAPGRGRRHRRRRRRRRRPRRRRQGRLRRRVRARGGRARGPGGVRVRRRRGRVLRHHGADRDGVHVQRGQPADVQGRRQVRVLGRHPPHGAPTPLPRRPQDEHLALRVPVKVMDRNRDGAHGP